MSNTTATRERVSQLGATWNGEGVNFALFSEGAEQVEVCLYDEPHGSETARHRLVRGADGVWQVFLPDLKPGQLYGYRVHGPYDPGNGHRFNASKVLLDPYAKAVCGELKWDDAVFGYEVGSDEEDLSFSAADSAPFVPKAVVIDDAFDWGDDSRPSRPLHESVIYEAHVRGLSLRFETLPEEVRGTYAGMASEPMLEYLRNLGVTTIELMPVNHFISGRHLVEQGLSDYWGYNSLAYFAPHARFAAGDDRGEQVREFKGMVKAMHAAGFEVILDVVYNHTAEGSVLGPTLSFRGIDNRSYYRLVEDDRRHCMDYSGTGNTLNVPHPRVLQLIMDSLRYWVTEMHVDGFRFDLAVALVREPDAVNWQGAFVSTLRNDPVLSQVKLIAEPWDLGDDGYQVGNFPKGWSEWNGRYRDAVRRFWRGDDGVAPELALRLAGSPDLFSDDGRTPAASVNFVTAHDGFTLRDLVSFNEPHNGHNGEEDEGGAEENHSWNCGHEGHDAPEEVLALRRRMQRNFLATLFVSQGVPMLRAGDERGATQQGHNNAYCQDNEISWLDWTRTEAIDRLYGYIRRLVALRSECAALCWEEFPRAKTKELPLVRLRPDGSIVGSDAADEGGRFLGLRLHASGGKSRSGQTNGEQPCTVLLYLNAHDREEEVRLPDEGGSGWRLEIDTTQEAVAPQPPVWEPRSTHRLPPHCLWLLRLE